MLGGFTLGMFIPWANSLVNRHNFSIFHYPCSSHQLLQGAFVGMFSSLIFTMWFGFGATFARAYGAIVSVHKPTTIDNCPLNILNETLLTTTTTTTTIAPDTEP